MPGNFGLYGYAKRRGPVFAAAGGGPSPVNISYTDGGTYGYAPMPVATFTSVAIGAAAADRVVIFGASMHNASSTAGLASATITPSGGSAIAATKIVESVGGWFPSNAMFAALVPTGATADIAITISNDGGGPQVIGIGVWRKVGGTGGVTPSDSKNSPNQVDPLTNNLIIPNNGGACGFVYADDGPYSWTGLDVDIDVDQPGGLHTSSFSYSGAHRNYPAGGTIAITADGPSAFNYWCLASWG